MTFDGCTTLRASLAEGRQGILLDGKRRTIVRVFDESPHGFRVATIQTTPLDAGAEAVLHVAGYELPVRVVARRTDGRRLTIVLQSLSQ